MARGKGIEKSGDWLSIVLTIAVGVTGGCHRGGAEAVELVSM